MKTVITAVGELKRAEPNSSEVGLTYRAVVECNVPKLVAQDMPIFEGIMRDVFPLGKDTPDEGIVGRRVVSVGSSALNA